MVLVAAGHRPMVRILGYRCISASIEFRSRSRSASTSAFMASRMRALSRITARVQNSERARPPCRACWWSCSMASSAPLYNLSISSWFISFPQVKCDEAIVDRDAFQKIVVGLEPCRLERLTDGADDLATTETQLAMKSDPGEPVAK